MPNSVNAAFSYPDMRPQPLIAPFKQKLRAWVARENPQLPLVLPIAFAIGIGVWFALPLREHWLAFIAINIIAAVSGLLAERYFVAYARPIRWAAACCFVMAAGMFGIWAKSLLLGAVPLEKPWVGQVSGVIDAVEFQPARDRVRIYMRPEKQLNLPQKIRLNVDVMASEQRNYPLRSGQNISARVRLMPPNAPVIPGGYDFAQRAWFQGLGATGSLLSDPRIIAQSQNPEGYHSWRNDMAAYVQSKLPGSAGGIAATLATGDRGGLDDADAEAMRRSGLAHLLALSGLHVSAVIGAVFLVIVKLLALSPTLALRFRLPILAAICGAAAGIAYTVFTGAEIPTVRACIAALLILAALILGRDPISLRLVGFAAFVVLLIWPEALIGPSFQMSFAAVIAIVALYDTQFMRGLSLKRDDGDFAFLPRFGRFIFMLFVTGLVIEITLIPIALYHFNKAGLYGALANLIAIPLTTFVIMPLEACALFADMLGLGAPLWWLCGKALSLLLGLAHFVSSTPGSNIMMPAMPISAFMAFVISALLLFCLRSPLRYGALMPALIGLSVYVLSPTPDLIIADDGRQFAVKNSDEDYILLNPISDSFATQIIREEAGLGDKGLDLRQWSGAKCSDDFCSFTVQSNGRNWVVLASVSNNYVPLRNLSAACARSDIVIAPRRLPYICRPKWLKIDRQYLRENGGVTINLDQNKVTNARITTHHGWRRKRKATD